MTYIVEIDFTGTKKQTLADAAAFADAQRNMGDRPTILQVIEAGEGTVKVQPVLKTGAAFGPAQIWRVKETRFGLSMSPIS